MVVPQIQTFARWASPIVMRYIGEAHAEDIGAFVGPQTITLDPLGQRSHCQLWTVGRFRRRANSRPILCLTRGMLEGSWGTLRPGELIRPREVACRPGWPL